MSETSSADFEDLVEALRALAQRARQEGGLRLAPGDVDLLEAAVHGLEQVPQALRDAMQTAFQLGREHGVKEELLVRLEREISEESGRLGREAWGKSAAPIRPSRHS